MPKHEPPSAGRPPALFWLLPACVALLRALPFLGTWLGTPPAGHEYLHLGYLPKDLLQYIAFMRMTAEHGQWLWADPFTTELQSGRFFMPFLAALGALAGGLHLDVALLFELSRIPLVFGLFWLLWRFLAPWLPEARARVHACVLVAFSGGIDAFARPFASSLPDGVGRQLTQSTWPLYGWNTFELCYNPLWIAGLIGVLVVLGPALRPGGPRGARDFAALGLGYLVLHFVHPYSAIAALAVLAGVFALQWILQGRPERARWLPIAACVLPALALALAFARWQAADPVYAAASVNLFGAQIASPFWYPLTYGALFVLALQGARHWARGDHPQKQTLLAWTGAIALLHSSPVLNGYHFVSFLHLPVVIAATPAFGDWLARARRAAAPGRLAACAGLALLFVDPLANSIEAVRDAREHHTLPNSQRAALDALAALPPGRVLCSASLGNLIPAFTDHRVWLGHHFLTPDYRERRANFQALVSNPARGADLVELVARERISAVVVTASQLPVVERALGPQIARRIPADDLWVLVLGGGATR